MKKEDRSSKILAFISYLLFFFGIIPLIIFLIKKHDKFVRYHAKHAIILFYVWLVINIITLPLKVFITGFVLLRLIIGLVFLVFWILGMVFSLKGKQKAII